MCRYNYKEFYDKEPRTDTLIPSLKYVCSMCFESGRHVAIIIIISKTLHSTKIKSIF